MLDVRLLGKFELKLDGELVGIPSRPAQSLLAYLILNAPKSYRRENLAGLLWPNSDETNARNNLRQALWRLRKSLGGEFFITDKVSVGFNPQSNYQLDVDLLQKGVEESAPADALIRTISVYEDKLLPGFYDDWVMLEQERLQAIYGDRMQMLLDRLVEEARWRETRKWAEQWIARGLIPEPAYRALMTAHAGLGDQASITAVFHRCVEALNEELGVEPSSETQNLFHRLTSGGLYLRSQKYEGKPTPQVKLPIQPTPFVGREDELSQLGTLLTDPALRLVTILGSGGMGKTRLAIESANVQSEAFTDGVYFVSLAPLDDPSLIISPIAEAINFSFHVRDQREQWKPDYQADQLIDYLCEKHLLLVLDNIEHLLNSSLPSLEERKKGAEELIADIIRGAPKIKILATSRERLNLHGETLFALDGLDFPKEIQPEEVQDIETYSAVQLFVKSAGRVRPEFELTSDNLADVIDICRLVDGMPLGIELAASWVELLSPTEIVTEIQNSLDFLETTLRDIPSRQRSIRSVFEATWNRLTETEREVFQQLSVFRDGFSREAAQTVTSTTLPVLMALVNKSLLRPDFQGRYHILELLRQFGTEHQAASPADEAATRDRHCKYYAAFLNDREYDLTGHNQSKVLAEIEVEIDNVRTAWNWAVAETKFDEMEQIMESLCEFYRVRGELDEGFETFYPTALTFGWQGVHTPEILPDSRHIFNETMHILSSGSSSQENNDRTQAILSKVLARHSRFYCESPSRAWKACQTRQDALKALSNIGAKKEMAWVLRYLAHARQTPWETKALYQKAIAIFEDVGEERGIAEILYRLGMVATQLGDYLEAQQLFQDSLTKSRKLGRQETIMFCLAELGYIQWALGDYQKAEELGRESLILSDKIGYPSYSATNLRYLARIAVNKRDCQTAKKHLQDSILIYEEIGLRGMKAEALSELAHVAVIEQNFASAGQLAQESINLCEERGHQRGMVEPLTVLGEVALGLDDFKKAGAYFRKALQKAVEVWVPPYGLHALVGMAYLLAAVGEKERALELATFTIQDPASWQWSKDSIAPLIAELETELPPNIVAAAQIWGKEKKLEEVIKGLMEVAV